MSELMKMLLACLVGGALGAIFFGGLWWTVRKGVASPRPALWFFGSLLVRTSVVLIGFYFAGHGHWQRLLACLFGFIVTRVLVTWLTRPEEKSPFSTWEAGNAP